MKNKKTRIVALLICLVIIIYITINYIITTNTKKIFGNWSLNQYNVYINNQLDKKISKNNKLYLIIDKNKITSNKNSENPNSTTFYYKTSKDKIYYSNNIIKELNNHSYEYYEYKITNKKLYIYQYSSNNLKKEEYIFEKM